jgi:hypothetical protein
MNKSFLVFYEDENVEQQMCIIKAPDAANVANFHQFKNDNWTLQSVIETADITVMTIYDAGDLETKIDLNSLDSFSFDDVEDDGSKE